MTTTHLTLLGALLGLASTCSAASDAWPWGMRAADFVHPVRLKITDAEIQERVRLYQRLGYDTLILGSQHFQLDYPQEWEDIYDQVARITRIAHKHGLKVIEHHSAGCIHEYQLDTPVGNRTLRDLCPVSAKTGTFDLYNQTMIFICPNRPAHWEVYGAHARRLMECGIDGLMPDDVELLNDAYTCACEFCRAKFLGRTGFELPPADDTGFWDNYDSPMWRRWLRFRQESVHGFHQKMAALRDEVAPNLKLLTCQCEPADVTMNVMAALAHDEIEPSMDVLFLEAMARVTGYFTDWAYPATNMKLLQAIGRGEKPVFPLYYAISAEKPFTIIHESPEALAATRPEGLWENSVAKQTGNYERAAYPDPQNHPGYDEWLFLWGHARLFGDAHWVTSNFDLASGFFAFQKAHERLWRRTGSVASVALHYSRATRDFRGPMDNGTHVNEWRAWAMMLLERSIPFDVVVDADLERPIPENIELLILPNSVCMSDVQCDRVRELVARGGRVIAIGDTSLNNEQGDRRGDFELAGLFGARYVKTVTDAVGALSWTEPPPMLRASLPRALKTADDVTVVERAGRAKVIATLAGGGLGGPAALLAADGRVLYLGAKLGTLGAPQRPEIVGDRAKWLGPRDSDWHRLMLNALRWGTDASTPVRLLDAPRGLIMSAHRSGDSVVVQLLNGTAGVRKAGETYDPRECRFEPVRPTRGSVKLELSESFRPTAAMLLSPDCAEPIPLEARKVGRLWRIELPSGPLLRYAMVVVEER